MDGEHITLYLSEVVPSKKNAWRSGGGRVFIDKDLRSELDALLYELIRQRNKLGLETPLEGSLEISIIFRIPRIKSDLDNMSTTVLDLLQKAKIIKNDRDVSSLHSRREIDPNQGPLTAINIR